MANSAQRPPRQRTLFLVLGVLIVSGWDILALVHPDPNGPVGVPGLFRVGLLLGTAFGQAALAAAWCPFGPLGLAQRIPLALAWLAVLPLALAINIAGDGQQSSDAFNVFLFGGVLLVHFLVIQAFFWLLLGFYGFQLTTADSQISLETGDRQFGILQVLIFTAIVAVLLATARIAARHLTWVGERADWLEGVLPYGVIIICSSLLAIPLIAAALSSRWPALAMCGAIGWAMIVTALEFPLFWAAAPGFAGRDDYGVLVCMNIVQAVWILGILAVLRFAGYRLLRPTPIASASTAIAADESKTS
jgi:hypothetical protein